MPNTFTFDGILIILLVKQVVLCHYIGLLFLDHKQFTVLLRVLKERYTDFRVTPVSRDILVSKDILVSRDLQDSRDLLGFRDTQEHKDILDIKATQDFRIYWISRFTGFQDTLEHKDILDIMIQWVSRFAGFQGYTGAQGYT